MNKPSIKTNVENKHVIIADFLKEGNNLEVELKNGSTNFIAAGEKVKALVPISHLNEEAISFFEAEDEIETLGSQKFAVITCIGVVSTLGMSPIR